MTLGRATTRRQLAHENESEDARVACVLDAVRDELERQQTKVVDCAPRPTSRVNRDADAAY